MYSDPSGFVKQCDSKVGGEKDSKNGSSSVVNSKGVAYPEVKDIRTEQNMVFPEGGWNLYEIHHITLREFGGSAEFENMVPLLKDVHRKVVTPCWNGYGQ